MAGTLLLIPKNKKLSDAKIRQFKKTISERLSDHYSRINYFISTEDSFIAEFRNNSKNKLFKHPDGSWLTYEGVVFALNKTLSYSAEELLLLYKKNGENIFEQLDGHYTIKMYDAVNDCHYVVPDFVKSKTNFLCETEDFIMFTSILAATSLIKKPELDLYSFNEYMWRYYILSERSILKDVQRLSAAKIYKICNGKIEEKQYWEWPKEYTTLDFHACVDKTAESMKETARLVQKEFPRISIDLTQGQDSRQVVAAFTNQNIPFEAFIFGENSFYEVENVKAMCARHSIPLRNVKLEERFTSNLWDYFKRAIVIGNGELPGFGLGRILHMREQIASERDVSLNGNVGFFYKNGLWDEMYTVNLYREPAQFNTNLFLKLRMLSKNYYDGIFSDEFLKVKAGSKKYISDLVDRVLKTHTNSPVAIQADLFGLNNWLNWCTANSNTVSHFIPSLSVLLLRRNIEFATTVPVKWKFNLSKFQRALVHKLDPGLAKEKTDFGGVNMLPKNIFTILPFYFRYYGFQGHRVINKIKSKLGFKVVSHLQEAWDYLPLYKKLYNDPEFRKNLDYESLELKTIIKKDEWEQLISSFETEEKSMNDFEYLFKLVSVEYFLKEAIQFEN